MRLALVGVTVLTLSACAVAPTDTVEAVHAQWAAADHLDVALVDVVEIIEDGPCVAAAIIEDPAGPATMFLWQGDIVDFVPGHVQHEIDGSDQNCRS